MASFLFLVLTGCLASPFEGTWLFSMDPEPRLQGDCVDPDDTTTNTGTSNSFVDIYKTGSGEFVVLFTEALVGDVSGSALSATWSEKTTDADNSDSEVISFDGTLKGGSMSGTITEKTDSTSGDTSYTCTSATSYTAERTVSDPNSYPEN